MATTTHLRDYMLRPLVNADPGTSDATDFVGRDVQDDDLDYLGRALTVTEWAATTAYAAGAFVALSSGEVLRVAVAGTSAAEEPEPPGYGETVEDDGVTWRQVTP